MEHNYEGMETVVAYQKYCFSYEGLGLVEKITAYLYTTELKQETDTLAVDIGCGTGFMTRVLASHFTNVIGIDCSPSQIKMAKENTKSTNVTYKEGVAENLDFLPPVSVDLVTVAIAMHLLEKDRFFAEVERVLKPGGCIALVMFDRPDGQLVPCHFSTDTGNKEVDQRCQNLLKTVYVNDILPYVGEPTQQMIKENILPSPGYIESCCFHVEVEKSGDIDLWVGLLNTLGGCLRGQQVEGRAETKTEFYRKRLLDILSEESTCPDTVGLTMKANIVCTVYRKPTDAKC